VNGVICSCSASLCAPLQHWPDAFKPGSGSSFFGDVCPKEGEKPPGCVEFDDQVTREQTWCVGMLHTGDAGVG